MRDGSKQKAELTDRLRPLKKLPRLGTSVALLALLGSCAHSPPKSVSSGGEPLGCAELLDREKATFVMHEVLSGRTLICNPVRAARRFVPASTFKIPHALIALETGIVADEHAPFEWDRRKRGVEAWDQDTSLAQAISRSTVWVFQKIARRIGHHHESTAVRRLRYGNADTGGPDELLHFWLRGPLAISASEQIRFLAELQARELQVDKWNQSRVAAMLRMRECGSFCTIYGKTGAVLPVDDEGFIRPDPNFLPDDLERTGWFVGWVERPRDAGGTVIFAHNLDLTLPGAMAARTGVAFAILNANGVLGRNPNDAAGAK